MGEFFSFIFISILVIWILGQVGKFFARRWIARKQREFAEQFGGAPAGGQGRGSTRRSRREGEVSVQQTMPVEKKVSKSVGDYVEFEEVEVTEQTEDKKQ